MAVLGLDKLKAINEITRARGEPPFSSIDSDGTGEAAEVERLLDTETRRVLEQEEWPDSIDYATPLTVNDEGNIIAPSDTLWIRGAAPNQYKNVTVRGDKVWDINRATDEFPEGTTIYVDICRSLPFEDLSPPLKDHIVARAAMLYARPMVSDPQRQGLMEDAASQDLSARRYGPQTERRPMVTGPMTGRFMNPNEPRRN